MQLAEGAAVASEEAEPHIVSPEEGRAQLLLEGQQSELLDPLEVGPRLLAQLNLLPFEDH